MESIKNKAEKRKTSAQTTNFLKFRAVKFSCLSNSCKKKEINLWKKDLSELIPPEKLTWHVQLKKTNHEMKMYPPFF